MAATITTSNPTTAIGTTARRGMLRNEAIDTARELARREGILAGFSTGANVAAALRLAATVPGLRVATVACDTGTRYLSTDLFTSE